MVGEGPERLQKPDRAAAHGPWHRRGVYPNSNERRRKVFELDVRVRVCAEAGVRACMRV